MSLDLILNIRLHDRRFFPIVAAEVSIQLVVLLLGGSFLVEVPSISHGLRFWLLGRLLRWLKNRHVHRLLVDVCICNFTLCLLEDWGEDSRLSEVL